MAHLYLGLGSNLGNREEYLRQAMQLIEEQIGPIVARSVLFVSKPWGFESGNQFLNACVAVETTLTPLNTLQHLKDIETTLGRPKKSSNAYSDRVIDLDILFYDDLVIQQDQLSIPHPLLHQRDFVLVPLAEIAPDLIHPLLNKSIRDLLSELNGRS